MSYSEDYKERIEYMFAPYPRTRIGRIIRDFQLSEETFKITDRKDFKRNYLE